MLKVKLKITQPSTEWKSPVENCELRGIDRLIAQFIQVCPIKTCSECRQELVEADFHKKRGKVDTRCKDCVSKQKASRYKRKKMNRTSASKRITKLISLQPSEVSETRISLPEESARLQELLQEVVIDVVATESYQPVVVKYEAH